MLELLGDAPRRRDLLIEHLHKIQDRYGHLSAAHLVALASEMKMAMAEVYEVATFYHHFDVVKEGDTAPPAITVRVCDSIACELAGLARPARASCRRCSVPACACCTRRASAAARPRRSRWSARIRFRYATAEQVAADVQAGHVDASAAGEREQPARARRHARATSTTRRIAPAGGYALAAACLGGSRSRATRSSR